MSIQFDQNRFESITRRLKARFQHFGENAWTAGQAMAKSYIHANPEVANGTQEGHRVYQSWRKQHEERYKIYVKKYNDQYREWLQSESGMAAYLNWRTEQLAEFEKEIQKMRDGYDDWLKGLAEDESLNDLKAENPEEYDLTLRQMISQKSSEIRVGGEDLQYYREWAVRNQLCQLLNTVYERIKSETVLAELRKDLGQFEEMPEHQKSEKTKIDYLKLKKSLNAFEVFLDYLEDIHQNLTTSETGDNDFATRERLDYLKASESIFATLLDAHKADSDEQFIAACDPYLQMMGVIKVHSWLSTQELRDLYKVMSLKKWEADGNAMDPVEKIAQDLVINYMYSMGIKFF